jgi:hypothetical protein
MFLARQIIGKNVYGLETAKPVVKQGRKAMGLLARRLPGCANV